LILLKNQTGTVAELEGWQQSLIFYLRFVPDKG